MDHRAAAAHSLDAAVENTVLVQRTLTHQTDHMQPVEVGHNMIAANLAPLDTTG